MTNQVVISILVLVAFTALLSLCYALWLYRRVKREEVSIPQLLTLSGYIREGAHAFLNREYRIIVIFIIIVFVLLTSLGFLPKLAHVEGVGLSSALCFLTGSLCSGIAGFIGMMAATQANCRVTQAAHDEGMSKALRVAFNGGSVLGICVVGFGLLGLTVLFLCFYLLYDVDMAVHVVAGYGLGCSLIALFARVGGGIYTKAADVGADLVGKVESGIPEDDPRNPAVIADNVGDNVGDIAGMGSDLCESYVGAIVSSLSLGLMLSKQENLGIAPVLFPLLVAALGIVAAIIAQYLVQSKPWRNPQKALSMSTYISNLGVLLGSLFLSNALFHTAYPFYSIMCGLIVGVLIGRIAEYYTSADFRHVKEIAEQSETGHATNIIAGFGVGMQSTALTILLLAFGIAASYLFFGMYGIALGAVGMLSCAGNTVSVDAYGPISDNAGGIAEMSNMEPEVRKITDHLDSVGNTTAAVGKGFCIGSAAFSALAMIVAYANTAKLDVISLLEPGVIVALLIGAMLPYFFTSLTIKSVGTAANHMIDEVRRQFKADPGIMAGTSKPDYARCVDISTAAALREMILPSCIAVISPIITGVLLGTKGLAGMLIGALLSAIMLAVFMANAGGAWDNAKKYIEEGTHGGKGSEAHKASVTGDTVGDPFKDTSGPAMDILIKLMSVISLILAPVLMEMTPLLSFLFK